MARIGEALTADFIAALMGQTPTNSLVLGLSNFWKRRVEEAREVLLHELRNGKRLDGDFDTDLFFSLMFRYLNAVKHGVARRNLRLLAQMIDSGISRHHEISVDEYSSLAEKAADLSREEIILLAALWRNHPTDGPPDSEEVRIQISNNTIDELVPRTFETKSETIGIASMLLRTGFVTLPSVWNGGRIDTTPKFYRLMKTCRLETVID
jgi:hypothetical protein